MVVQFVDLLGEIRNFLPVEEARVASALPTSDKTDTILALEKLLTLSIDQQTPEAGLREALSGGNRRAALAAVLLYRLYDHPLESSRDRTLAKAISNECGSYLFSMFRELQGWEPASPLDLALVVMTDRAVIRSARVAAAHVDPEAFMHWLSASYSTLTRGAEHWTALGQWLESMPKDEPDVLELRQREAEFHQIVRRSLRDYGIMHGRSGLQNIRNELGATRIPAKTAEEETRYSEDVVLLAGHFIKLTPGERKAFRVLAARLESAEARASSPK